jgi:DNA-binding response OmpR family regulator
VCRRLKADAVLSSIPVILISSTLKGHADNLDGLRWGGADGYVLEPFEPGVLASTIRSVLA